ncbi:MAG: ArsC/Spx/MgsR family protein [Fluviicoccus sp.]|uniref:ArsC/Spx/MgsR family protein n=1 Tax=Fluviicoccus sp. TaxID=2003552 RepID=UPI00271F13C3|nr:ArsC/Spx/MgsR family protein [Fluviicoccus sp.]MDO8329451.1 ArsC/Spx/MgsR family protein [Fluviicoccus sp.]
MSSILFYEKPGCGGNALQKKVLEAAGAQLQVKNLLTEPWTAASLQPFLTGKPVAEWFNMAAPRIRNGDVQPDHLDEVQALALLLAEPLLIRRPLIRYGDFCSIGFDWPGLAAALELDAGTETTVAALEGCIHHPAGSCRHPQEAEA